MRSLIAPTEDFIKRERTSLAADVSAGSNVTLTLDNNDGMADDNFLVIGREGSEKAELQQINAAVSGATNVQVATLLRAHKAGEPVTVYRYDKRKFYGSTSKTGSYTELTSDGSPVAIQVDDPQGTLIEYTGGDGYTYFKATYYNSQTAEETSLDDSEGTLADESSRYASLYGIRKMAGFTENPYITDGRIEDKRRQAENEINSSLFNQYTLPLSEVPPLVTYICECLAAGYIHYEEFGSEGEGGKKLGEARALLKSIANGNQKLLDSDMAQLSTVQSANRLSGKPDGSEIGGETRKFSISQKF
jgi:phage gp36-like protein